MVLLLLFVAGTVIGGAVGRWPVVLLAIPVGVVIALRAKTEISPLSLGAGYGVAAAVGLALGVWLGRRDVR